MRRLTVSLTVVAMIAALLPVAALMASAQTAAPAPTITPPAGETAVRQNDTVTVSGDAGDMAGGSVQTHLVAFGSDGVLFRDEVFGVSVSGGQYQGSVTLPCSFHEPAYRCDVDPAAAITGVALEVEGAALSNILRVDYTDPEIVRYELVNARTVRVVFSEPVRMPSGQSEKVTDWDIDEQPPLRVNDPKDERCAYPEAGMTTGCTRLLTLTSPQSEDATPFVRYLPLTMTLSAVYVDYTGNSLAISSAENSEALDRIRPPAPNIQTIDGKSARSGEVVSNEDTPTVRVTNLLANHTARLLLKRDGGGTRTVETTVAPDTNAVDLTLPAMTDGGYTVTAIAIDAAGNRSNDDTKTGPAERSDGAVPSATYVLDRVAPEVLAAALIDTKTVGVNFTEPILPDGHAGRWFVGNVPVTATGSGDSRTLKSDVSLLNAGPLRWEPTSSEAGSNGLYGDTAGNGMAALSGLALSELPALSAPVVNAPAQSVFTRAGSVTVRGTADSGDNLVAELFDRGSEKVLQSTPVSDGRWAISRDLSEDGRYSFEIRIRNTQTGVFSQRAQAPDVVRDTAAPKVEVSEPAGGLLGAEAEYGVGDTVTVTWTASDPANDDKLSDHADAARVILVSSTTGTRRAVSGRIEVQPGREQSFTYRLTNSDLEDEGVNDLHFDVNVDDLAGNKATDTSGTIKLLATRIGYTPVLVGQTAANSIIEARFPATLTGEVLPNEWLVDGTPLAIAAKSEDAKAVILTVPLETDPNARPVVQFQPTLGTDQRLRGPNNRQITEGRRRTLDRISPALAVQTPGTPAVVDRDRVVFSGTTDNTAYPNTIIAFRTRANGERVGRFLAKRAASGDGTWKLAVPLVPNRINRIVVQAVDPSGNRSELLPSSPYTVTEDSVAPVVRITSPQRAARVQRVLPIRWDTVERHPRHARIQFRVRGGSWKTITSRTADDGYFRATLPKHVHGDIFDIRVTAFDKTNKRRTAYVSGLLGDFSRPVVRRSVSVGARSVRLFFSEPVYMPRFGYTVDGIGVRRVVHNGAVNTLILDRPLSRTTPVVRYNATRTRDLAGNKLAAFEHTAQRGFVFAPTNVNATRINATRVRVEWSDTRNRAEHVKYYRIYRNGTRIGTVDASRRAFADTRGRGSSTYSVRAFDNERRYSAAIGDYVR